jgi:glutathione S-transferase
MNNEGLLVSCTFGELCARKFWRENWYAIEETSFLLRRDDPKRLLELRQIFTLLCRYTAMSATAYTSPIFGLLVIESSLILAVQLWLIFNLQRARISFRVRPPSTEGPPAFERAARLVEETGQLLVVLLPSLWICAVFVNSVLGLAAGAVWLIARVLFAVHLYQVPRDQEFADPQTNKLITLCDQISHGVVRLLVLCVLIGALPSVL